MNVYTRRNCLWSMKPERIEAAQANGVAVLDSLDGSRHNPDGIYLADARPRGFKGARTDTDPADTAILSCKAGEFKVLHQFSNFERAIKKAFAIAATN